MTGLRVGDTSEADETGEKVKKPRATRKLELTPEMFEAAGRCALTWKHLSGIYGVDLATIADRMRIPEFKEAFERGKLNSQTEVIRQLFAHMEKGSLKAATFLAQAWCHLSTKHEVTYDAEITQRYVVEVPPDEPTLEAWSQANAKTIDHRPN
jgi:hypothetical protein